MIIFYVWMTWPAAARWASGIIAFWILSAILPAFHEPNPAAAFGENFVALGVHYGLLFGGIGLAVWFGRKIFEKTGKAWLAWMLAIGMFAIAGFAQLPLGSALGVSAKLESLMNSDCYVEYDGRTSLTVCD